jgi:Fungal Zn(2)-Cys(6) binuclear cluster domain
MPKPSTLHHHFAAGLDVMATAVSSPSSITSRPTHSCIRCADRKVKCDRQRPCSACVKHNIDCVFNPSQPPRKRHKRVNDQILTDRLRRYEALLQAQGIDPSKLPDTLASEPPRRSSPPVAVTVVPNEFRSQTSSSVESEPSRFVNKTQIVHGQGRFQFVDK